MVRNKSIRITSNDIKEFKRLAKNTKTKINRTFKNYGIDLSGEIEIPKSVNEFKTRAEFNAWKEKSRQLTNRNNTEYQFRKNKYGVVASVKEINEAKRRTKRAQRVAKDLIKKSAKKDFLVNGKKVSTVGQRMQQMGKNAGEIHIPPNFNFDTIVNRKHFNEKMENLEERSKPNFLDIRSERLKQNYIKLLGGAYNSDADELIQRIEAIPSTDFFELFLMHEELQFDFEYTEEQTEANLNKKISIIERYEHGKIKMDLKGF